jgi:hypothetical protein
VRRIVNFHHFQQTPVVYLRLRGPRTSSVTQPHVCRDLRVRIRRRTNDEALEWEIWRPAEIRVSESTVSSVGIDRVETPLAVFLVVESYEIDLVSTCKDPLFRENVVSHSSYFITRASEDIAKLTMKLSEGS